MGSSDEAIRRVLEKQVSWLPLRPASGMIVISCRIRLARNVAGYPFPLNAAPIVRGRIRRLFQNALGRMKQGGGWEFIDMETLDDFSVALLFERKLISREFRNRAAGRALAVSPDPHLSVMVNEEDHLRLQYCRPGGHLREVWRRLSRFSAARESELPCAFLPGLGYATSCPTNLGTGLRASVMMPLPALTIQDKIKQILQSLGNLGLTVRGLHGEGSEILGNLYQISNQTTLGETEEAVIERLEETTALIAEQETAARNFLMAERPAFLMNVCARAYAILRHSCLMGSPEALNLLSLLRLGIDCGLFPSVRIFDVNRMMLLVQPAHLIRLAGHDLSPEERGIFRATLLRRMLGNNAEPPPPAGSSAAPPAEF